MKKTLSSLIVASMIVNAVPSIIPMNIVSAAQVNQVTKVKGSAQYLFVDGVTQIFSAIQVKGKTLFSVKDIAKHTHSHLTYDAKTKTYKLVGNEHTVTFKRQTDYLTTTNGKVSLTAPITTANNQTYIELEPLVRALGGDIVINEATKTKFIATQGLLSGSYSNAKWVNGSNVLFTSEDSKAFLLNVRTKKVVNEFPYSELVVSPDGKQALFTDDNDLVQLLNLETGATTQISSDDTFKSEFTWSTDGSRVYFLQGDKSETVSSMLVADGTITKIVDDKVEYKSNLVVSNNGNKILYTTSKQAETKYTDDTKTDVDTIVTDDTEPQIYSFDTTVQGAKSVAITTSKENKFFTTLLANGNVLYLSEDPENEDKLPELKMIAGQTDTTVVSDKQIESVKISAKGYVYLLVTEADESSSIYKLELSSLKLEKKLNTTQIVSDFNVSMDEKKIIATVTTDNGDKISVLQNGCLEDVTKN